MNELLKHFKRQPNGSWSCVKPMSMQAGPGGFIGLADGRNFKPGETFMDIDLVAELEAMALLHDDAY